MAGRPADFGVAYGNAEPVAGRFRHGLLNYLRRRMRWGNVVAEELRRARAVCDDYTGDAIHCIAFLVPSP
ncbi:hypothetical protein PLANPX_0547 [Lacipirellula parvula]|uniref:Uncharacterized protein n=1 Tax=Lacipirellula parvula TaxID=2650471 RepID=A0A5K7X3I5_9BACT|nr:hypothetical protein PLANPX_0547 [Lacipirellula parvula]